MSDKNTTHFF